MVHHGGMQIHAHASIAVTAVYGAVCTNVSPVPCIV
jgi:hypothetical protein